MAQRIQHPGLRRRARSAEAAAALIADGMTVAVGGYVSSGYPKAVLRELAMQRAGSGFAINVITGSNMAPIDTLLAEAGIVARRTPMIEGKAISAAVNRSEVHYVEQQMHRLPRLLRDAPLAQSTSPLQRRWASPPTLPSSPPRLWVLSPT